MSEPTKSPTIAVFTARSGSFFSMRSSTSRDKNTTMPRDDPLTKHQKDGSLLQDISKFIATAHAIRAKKIRKNHIFRFMALPYE